jgi:hypothetical protein
MTLIVGVRCEGGIVIAADSAATMGNASGATAEHRAARKLTIEDGKLIVGVSGHVGLGQRLAGALRDGYRDKKFKGAPHVAVQHMREAIVPVVRPEYEMGGLVAHATGNPAMNSYAQFAMLVAIPIEKEPYLVNFSETCAPEYATENIPFICIGSGSRQADPFVGFVRKVLWPEKGYPPLADGTLGAYWIVQHGIQTGTGGVGGAVQLAVLHREGSDLVAREVSELETREQDEALAHLEKYVRGWRSQFTRSSDTAPPPEPPA